VPTLPAESLKGFVQTLFKASGVAADEAMRVASSLVDANLCGHDSHGVMRIPSYVDRVREGRIHPRGGLVVERESASGIACRGEWGFGQVVCRALVPRLVAMARATGAACGTLRETAHIGRLGEWAELACAEGCVALICANTHGSGQRVAPINGKRPRLGTNPLCVGFPGGAEGPFLLDFGTSATAEGKVRVKRIAGQSCPPGWLLDAEGRPTTDPNTLYGNPPGTILPMGGDQAYKGFGLAFLIELLCGALSGGACAHPDPPPPLGNCATFVVFDPARFTTQDALLREVRQLEQYVRGVPRIDPALPIVLPGDPERQTRMRRRAEGIPLDDGNWRALVDLAGVLNVRVPDVS